MSLINYRNRTHGPFTELVKSEFPDLFHRAVLACDRERLTGKSRMPLLTERERARVEAATRFERIRGEVTIDRRAK